MSLKGPPRPAAAKRHKKLYFFCVIALSVTIVIVVAATILSRFSATARGAAAAQKAVTMLSRSFRCTADVTASGKDYEVHLLKSADSCTMTIVKPANLSPLSFEKTAKGITVKSGSLELEVDANSIPQSSVFNAVLGAFEAGTGQGVNVRVNGADTILSGSANIGRFTIVLDSAMKPKSLSLPSLKLNAKFKDFEYL